MLGFVMKNSAVFFVFDDACLLKDNKP